MGVWDLIGAINDKLRNAADSASVKGACRSSYDYGRTTVSKIGNAVEDRVIPKLKPYLPDEQGQATIGRLAKTATFYSLEEGAKWIPGGTSAFNVIKRTIGDENIENHREVMKEQEARIHQLETELSGIKKLLHQSETLSCNPRAVSLKAPCLASNVNQTPEDVIRIFMEKNSGGGRILDALLVPRVGNGKTQK